MAGVARRGESSRSMVRVVRSIPICLVTAEAGSGQSGVIIVRVALRAAECCVRASKREGRVVVVEGRWTPATRGVTDGTVGRESRGDMVRTLCTCKVRLMAGVTRRGGRGVVVVRVALNTRQCGMHSCERVLCVHRMIEVDVSPVGCGMARIASGWKRRSDVIRICGPDKIRLVAAVASRG
jgi:hypothetical protein